ncbi:UNVERIFIED_CONTAM: hypothetical protein FKN15_025856 [Acipenser sinensis]
MDLQHLTDHLCSQPSFRVKCDAQYIEYSCEYIKVAAVLTAPRLALPAKAGVAVDILLKWQCRQQKGRQRCGIVRQRPQQTTPRNRQPQAIGGDSGSSHCALSAGYSDSETAMGGGGLLASPLFSLAGSSLFWAPAPGFPEVQMLLLDTTKPWVMTSRPFRAATCRPPRAVQARSLPLALGDDEQAFPGGDVQASPGSAGS